MKRNDRLHVEQTIPWVGKDYRGSFLLHLITTYNIKLMAEVGVKFGRTTFFLLDNVPDLKIYAVDINIKDFYNSDVAKKYGDRLVPIQGLSYQVTDQLADDSLDLVFIDADHGYDSVKRDIIAYTPKLKTTGLLTGHDIDYPGVNKAVKELIKEFDIGPNFVWVKK